MQNLQDFSIGCMRYTIGIHIFMWSGIQNLFYCRVFEPIREKYWVDAIFRKFNNSESDKFFIIWPAYKLINISLLAYSNIKIIERPIRTPGFCLTLYPNSHCFSIPFLIVFRLTKNYIHTNFWLVANKFKKIALHLLQEI